MNKDTREAYKLFHDGTIALSYAEQHGLRVDTEYIRKQNGEISGKIKQLENEFKATKFFKDWESSTKKAINIYSGAQLGTFLYRVKKIEPVKTTAKGTASTDEEALNQLNIPELQILLRIKKLKAIRDTFLASIYREQVDGHLRPFFNLHLVRTYRSSSDKPNFQNVPKRDKESMQIVRKSLYPRKGHQLLELDYKQLEVRIAACYNEDEKLMYDIEHGDMHGDMAKELFVINNFDGNEPTHSVLRAAAKNGFVFPQFYGDYYKNCSEYLIGTWCKLSTKTKWKKGEGIEFENGNISDHLIEQGFRRMNDFTEHVRNIEADFWGKRYRKYDRWKQQWWRQYLKDGFFESKTGFTFKGVYTFNDVTNYPIQGSAFHVLLWSLIEGITAQRRGGWRSRILGQIHDAIVIDVYPPELDKVIHIMKCIMENDVRQHWPWIITPLVIDAELCPVDGSWAEKEKYKID
jgi:DNA polymerase I